MTFRAGDVVKHGPSGETWTLSVDEDGGRAYWCGYPLDGYGLAKDCTLEESATDDKRVETLRDVSRARTDHGDLHQVARIALHTLHAEKLCGEACPFCDTERRSALAAAERAVVEAAMAETVAEDAYDQSEPPESRKACEALESAVEARRSACAELARVRANP